MIGVLPDQAIRFCHMHWSLKLFRGRLHDDVLGVHRPYAAADKRTDSIILGIGAAHVGAPAVYHMGGGAIQSARVAETHDQRRTNNTNNLTSEQQNAK